LLLFRNVWKPFFSEMSGENVGAGAKIFDKLKPHKN
jgi:hypothetical protein